MMQELLPKVFVVSSPVFELLASMFRLQSHERLSKGAILSPAQDFDLDQWIERVRQELPDDTMKSLEHFFHIESFIGLSLVQFAWRTNTYSSCDDFLNLLRATSPYDLFALFMQTGYLPGTIEDIHDTAEVTDFIKKSALPEIEKWKLAYMYLDIENTKQRFTELVAKCYALYFKNEWENLKRLQAASIRNLMGQIKTRKDISHRFPYMDEKSVLDTDTTIVLAPSVLYHFNALSSDDETGSTLINLYGVRYLDARTGYDEIVESLKLISDETRIKIIKMLNTGPRYGYELAERLNLTSSTISHHLAMLSAARLVSPIRRDNRVYYELNKDNVRELMASLTTTLCE
jgi:DNA-binding transcriptional ArsR family regulator